MIGRALALAVLVGAATPALAQAQNQRQPQRQNRPQQRQAQGELVPGAAVRIYQVGASMDNIPEIAEGQRPNIARVVETIDFEGEGFLGIGNANFVTVVTGFLRVEEPGEYAFRLTSDDGSALSVAGREIIRMDQRQGTTFAEGSIRLQPGDHPFRVTHFDAAAAALLRLSWQPPSARAFRVIKAGDLVCNPNLGETAPGNKRLAQAGGGSERQGSQDGANSLSARERAQGWQLLFDGESLEHWRGYKAEQPGDAWKVEDGRIVLTGSGGDLMTRQKYEDFDLRLEWAIEPGGNSGIIYGIAELPEAGATYITGPEMQILDAGPDAQPDVHAVGSNYALNAPTKINAKPAGEWNEARLVKRGDRVEHWLNGEKVVEYEWGSDDWQRRVANSKFANWPYGEHKEGHIALQDHGNRVMFRNIKIRELD